MWRRVLACLLVCLLALAGADFADAANKKKKTKKTSAPPAITKPIYEAPMRVVIVRSSNPACEPLCPEWIAAEGEITGSTPGAFSKVFKQIGKRKLPVIIRSPGGSINAALEIGRMVRKRGLDVSLGWTNFTGCAPDQKSCKLPPEQKGVYRGLVMSSRAFCNSACPLILAGGITRLAPSDAYVGVHQPKTIWTREIVTYREHYRIVKGKKKVIDRKIVARKPGKSRVTYGHDKALRKKLTAYYKEMGVDPKILDEAEKTKYKDIDYLTPAEVQQFNLRTLPAGPETLAGPNVCSRTPVPGNCAKGDEDVTLFSPAKKSAAGSSDWRQALLKRGIASTNPEMSFTFVRSSDQSCEPTCPEWLAAVGIISPESPRQLRRVLKEMGARKLPLVLDSLGGDVDASMEMGRIISQHQLVVVAAKTHLHRCGNQNNKCKKGSQKDPKKGFVFLGNSCTDTCIFPLAAGKIRVPSWNEVTNPLDYESVDSPEELSTRMEKYFGSLGYSSETLLVLRSIPRGKSERMRDVEFGRIGLNNSEHWGDATSKKENCKAANPIAVCIKR